jgi:hypothetical protein
MVPLSGILSKHVESFSYHWPTGEDLPEGKSLCLFNACSMVDVVHVVDGQKSASVN